MCNDILYSLVFDPCVFNLPGVTKLRITLAKWVLTFPDNEDYDAAPTTANALTINGDIVLDTTTYPEAQWFEVPFEVDQNDLKSEYQGTGPSGYYQTTGTGFIPSSSRAAFWAFHKATKSDLIISVDTRNEDSRILGRPKNPANLVANHDSGKAAPDKAGFSVTVNWNAHGEPAPFYDGAF